MASQKTLIWSFTGPKMKKMSVWHFLFIYLFILKIGPEQVLCFALSNIDSVFSHMAFHPLKHVFSYALKKKNKKNLSSRYLICSGNQSTCICMYNLCYWPQVSSVEFKETCFTSIVITIGLSRFDW